MSPKDATNSRRKSSNSQDQDIVANRQSRLLNWAWEFLRRSPEYRSAYARWTDLTNVVHEDGGLPKSSAAGGLTNFSAEWAEQKPVPVSYGFFATWVGRARPLGDIFSIALPPEIDPRPFLLGRWLDPSLDTLPEPELENFFVPVLELEEARALERRKDLPIYCDFPWQNSDDIDSREPIGYFSLSPEAPITKTYPDGFTEHSWDNLNIRTDRPTQMALRFDLALPLDLQLISAKRQLYAARQEFEATAQAKLLKSFRSKEQPQSWPQMLDLLDVRETTGSDSAAVDSYLTKLENGRDLSDKFDGLLLSLRRARAIRDGEYQGLIMAAFEIK